MSDWGFPNALVPKLRLPGLNSQAGAWELA